MDNTKKLKEKCIRIDWVDSNGYGHWHGRDEEKCLPSTCVSVGIIEKETKEAICIKQSHDKYIDRIDNSITIPKCAIKSIKRFSI